MPFGYDGSGINPHGMYTHGSELYSKLHQINQTNQAASHTCEHVICHVAHHTQQINQKNVWHIGGLPGMTF